MNDLFSIGEVSKILDVSLRTLRHYDKIDLLKPAFIDADTHYRYYSSKQILNLYIIKELKYQGFTLSDIKDFFKKREIKSVADLYRDKRKEVEKELENLKLIKHRLDERIEVLDKLSLLEEKCLAHNGTYMDLKEIPEREILYIRKEAPFNVLGVTFRTIELFNLSHEKNIQTKNPYMIIFHDDYKHLNIFKTDYEICVEVTSDVDKDLPFIRKIPKSLFATAMGKGSYEESMASYKILSEWIENNGYEAIGPLIKVYISNLSLAQSIKELVWELQVPIQKKAK